MPAVIVVPYPSDLSDQEWIILAPVLPLAKPGGRPRTVNRRVILNGVFPVLRRGCHWRLLPRDSGPWSTVSASFRRWRRCRRLGAHPHPLARAGAAGGGTPAHAQRQPTPSAAISAQSVGQDHRARRPAWL